MMELATSSFVCSRCGRSYGRRKGYYPVSYSSLYKGTGYLSVCKDCVEAMYDDYLKQSGDQKAAVRQICRKLDLYWSESIYGAVEKKTSPRTIIISYIAKSCTQTYAGKSYDDTLIMEKSLWDFSRQQMGYDQNRQRIDLEENEDGEDVEDNSESVEIPDDVKLYWGSGFTPEMYIELESRRQFWLSKYPEGTILDPGEDALLRQVCNLEITINHDRAAGKAIDKNVNALNSLLGSMNIKPSQKKDDGSDDTLERPLGVWLYKYEHKRPLPDTEDDNRLKKYIFTWMGHVCKMLGIKNTYQKMYNEEISRLSVQKPEFDGDEEELLIESYSEDSDITPDNIGGDDE